MKNIAIIVTLALVGAGLAFGYLKWSESQKSAATSPESTKEVSPPVKTSTEHDGHDHSGHDENEGHDHAEDAHGEEAGATASAADGTLCAKHRIPERIDGFCHPEVVERMGFCKEHDVPEAFCTRCSPVLIVAFKAENDWCAEHNLPESQCAACKGTTTPGR